MGGPQTTDYWTSMQRALIHEAYATIDNDPTILLETDGGPYGVKAHLTLARLIGFDDQIVQDGYRLDVVEAVVYVPIPVRMTMARAEPSSAPWDLQLLRRAEYRLQSNYATTTVDAMHLPPDVDFDPATFQATILFLRYRRRL